MIALRHDHPLVTIARRRMVLAEGRLNSSETRDTLVDALVQLKAAEDAVRHAADDIRQTLDATNPAQADFGWGW